jgi:hypothetical protein
MRTVSNARVREDAKTPIRTALEMDASAAKTSMQPITPEANMINRSDVGNFDDHIGSHSL